MNNFLPIKRNHRAAPLRLAARIISIMILAFLWPVRGGAQEQTPSDLNVSNITDATTLTYKKKSDPDTYAWYYKIGTDGTDIEFTGTLTGSEEKTDCPVITIKSEKEATSPNYDDCAKLILNGVKLTAAENASLFIIGENTKPLCIQATSESTLKCKATDKNSPYVIKNDQGGILLLDGGDAGLNIIGEGGKSHGIYLYTTSSTVNGILKGKINIVADDEYAVSIGNTVTLSAAEDAKITASAGKKAILDNNVKSPFLRWEFEAAPEPDKTLEIKDVNGKSFSPAIQFKTDGNNKSFAINVTKGTGYTVWLGDKKLMDKNDTTVFTATDDKLFSFSGMQTYLAKNWPDYGQTANVGPDGTDISVSGTNSNTTYTVNTARGLAWIGWVTNEGKTKEGNANETHTDCYPDSTGFKYCTVKLNDNISLAKPNNGVDNNFKNNWIPIGFVFSNPPDYDPIYTKCFRGTFDGNNKTITGMTISSTSILYTGLFGYLYGATVKNLTMAESENINLETLPSDNTSYRLGSIAGYVENGKIINCHNKCAIGFSNSDSKKGGYVGGIAGQINGSVISACSNSGAITVSGSSAMGSGIVGASFASFIVSCFNTGDISATSNTNSAYAGGIVGSSDLNFSQSPSHILHCYSTGDMTAIAAQSSASGGIVGGARYVVIESCFATGTVSATSSSNSNGAYAGGIIGWSWSDNGVTVKDCLALNTGGMKALGTTSEKLAGRIIGKKSNATLLNNYASTKIKLKLGDNDEFIPAEEIAADAINGADTFLDEVAAEIAAWAGSENTKAFTAIGTATSGKLPQLKAVDSYGNDGLPTAYKNDLISGQPTDLASSSYLASLEPLSLLASNTDLITLSFSDGKWSYKKGEGETSTRFTGTVKMAESAATSTNKLVIATATGNPTLTFEKVVIKPTDGVALTIDEACALTLNTADEGTSTLSSSGASTLVNKGILTLTGNGLHIGNTGDNNENNTNEYYGLNNSGTFTVTDPSSTSVTFHCANIAIHNTGALTNAWMEWQFAEASGGDGKIAFAATDDENQSPAAQLRQGKTFATTVTAGKTYRLWTVTNNSSEVRTRQQGKTSAVPAVPVDYFQAPSENGVAVFTDVKDAVPVTVTQPTAGGGTISVFSGDSLLAKADTLPNGVKLTLKNYPLPGYELDAFAITPTGNSNPTSEYTVPDDATAVTITASFKAKAVAPVDTTQANIVDNVETLPETLVEKPTAVIAKGNTTASNNADSEVKLITGALEPEHKGSVKDTLGKIAANISESNIIFAEIALVEITTTSGSGGAQMTTMTPIQPKDGHTVHVVYPYPSGTNNNDSFVIVHLKTDGTMEVYRDVPDTSKGEMKLDKTARGLEFDVDSFSPFGIAWTKAANPTPDPDPVPDPTPVYYTVTLPAVEGATTDPVADNYEVAAWSSFRFYLTLAKDYDQSVPVVTTSRGETLEPRTSDGAYIIKYVRTPVTISIAGIQKNTDVANATIEAGVKVWTEPSVLCLQTDRAEEVRILTLSGAMLATFKAQPGLTRRPLAPGLYIVQTARTVCKVIVR